MAYSTRRYTYDEDTTSTQSLWVIVLVVAAMVGSFLFGKYVLGDRLRRDADTPAGESASAPLGAQPPPAPETLTGSDVPLPQPPAGMPGGSPAAPGDVRIVTGATEEDLTAELPTATEQLNTAATDQEAAREEQRRREDEARRREDREAREKEEEAKRKADEERARREAEDKKKKEEADRQRREEARRRAASTTAPRPPAGTGSRPAPTPAEPATAGPSSPAPSSGLVRVRAGSFDSRDAANARRQQLAEKGHDALVVVRESGGRQVYDLQVGAFESRENANTVAEQLRREGFEASVSGN